jgi:CubicO group peptidase (beta-lactamase class C family)
MTPPRVRLGQPMVKPPSLLDTGLANADALMQQGLANDVFPGAVLLVALNDAICFHRAYGVANRYSGRPMTTDTVFDLASLTKPLATAMAVMRLVADSGLDLDLPVGRLIPAFRRAPGKDMRLCHLLEHSAGLADYRPYYLELQNMAQRDRKAALRRRLASEPAATPGSRVCYSDIGFMVLEWVVETVSGSSLDRYVEKHVYRHIGGRDLFFPGSDASAVSQRCFAATEYCPWRRCVMQGQVHDENAWVQAGVAGHAGLFGTAGAVFSLLAPLLAIARGNAADPVFSRQLVARFFSARPGGRALGFDRPSRWGSSSGRWFSPNSVGHLGFTGTSFWIDVKRAVTVILLTNRVHPSRENNRIREFRPRLHDAIMAGYAKGLTESFPHRGGQGGVACEI